MDEKNRAIAARLILQWEGRPEKARHYLEHGVQLNPNPIPRHQGDTSLVDFAGRRTNLGPKSKVKGVSFVKSSGRWRADHAKTYLGVYATQEEAAEAVAEARRNRAAEFKSAASAEGG